MKWNLFPTLRGYRRENLGKDVFSGVLIAALSIPISMGYAQIAGLPPVYGLYGSVLPIFLFAMLSTSPLFIFGVDAAPAAMVGAVLLSLGVAPGSAEAMQLVPALAFYTGLWLLLFSLLGAGKAVDYISTPVMGGFISGICCEIILMQTPKLLGSAAGSGELFELLACIWAALKTVNVPSLLLGAATLALLLLGKKYFPKVPMVLVMLVAGALMTVVFHIDQYGVALLAAVEPGLPKFVLPALDSIELSDGLSASLPVAIVILAETLLAENSYALKRDEQLDCNREILAFSLGNFAAALVGCCPVNGSVSRTAVNERNGGRTQLVSVVASVTMLLVLLLATGFIRYLPVPVLTAIVINALLGAVEFDLAKRLLHISRQEFFIFLGAFVGVLLLGAINGVVLGVVLSFVDVIIRAAAPRRAFLGVLPGKPGFYALDRVTGAKPIPHVVLYRFSGSLFFANVRLFQEDLEQSLQPDTTVVIVDASAVASIDITAADRLLALYQKLRARGVRFYLTEHIGEVNDKLRQYGAEELIDNGAVRRTIQAALLDAGIRHAVQTLSPDVSQEFETMRQLQEFEWAYGADAEERIEQHVRAILDRLQQTAEDRRAAALERCLHEDSRFAGVDEDELLLHLEGHTQELSALLGMPELRVLAELESERRHLFERLASEHPELVHSIRDARMKFDADFRARHPNSASHMDALRKHLHERYENR